MPMTVAALLHRQMLARKPPFTARNLRIVGNQWMYRFPGGGTEERLVTSIVLVLFALTGCCWAFGGLNFGWLGIMIRHQRAARKAKSQI